MKINQLQKNIPTGWQQAKLGDVGKVSMCKRIFNHETLPEGDIPFYKISTFGKIADSFILNETYERYSKKYPYPKKGEILISASGTIGRTVVFDGEKSYFQDSNIVWISNPQDKVLNNFLRYVYSKTNWKSTDGGIISRLYNEDIRSIRFLLPPLLEQNRIVLVLETWDKSIEKLIEKIEVKKKIKLGLNQTILTGKNRLSGFNGKWKVFSLKEVSRIYDGTHQTPTYLDKGIPFYSVEHVTANNFQDTKYISEEVYENETKKVRIEKGDILMTRIGSIGAIKYVDWDVKASFYVTLALLKVDKKFDSKALSFFLTTRNFQDELYGKTLHVAFPIKINLGDIGECKIHLPEDIKEQKAIAEILTTADKEITQLEKKLSILKEQKRYLLNNLITGTIRTPETLSTKLTK